MLHDIREKHPDQEITVTTNHPNEVALFRDKRVHRFSPNEELLFSQKGSVLF